ncbi:hypothetical protein [Pseudonocardia acidicola]|uniref:Uncharacterized protein n=1 Tax=Pseudonocardia acidicola TaxID=2724939 RepID=A0ABX1S437_9PSEU|nr:hypothetical protein [Pseudonocardia acidicola]NMH96366.1 hypothetical protein [Pseudonocardia acidicola]
MSEPTAADVIGLGGWNPRYARVLAIAATGPFAVALIDTNGDESEIDIDHLWLDDTGRWRPGSSSGVYIPPVGVGDHGETTHYRYAVGRAEAPGEHHVQVAGAPVTVTAQAGGWWAWLALW